MIVSFSYVCKKRTIIVQVIDWHLLIETFQYISSLHIRLPKIIIPNLSELFLESVQKCLFIWCTFPKTRKPNVFWIPFRDQYAITVIPLFNHVGQVVCIYLSMCIRLKWVESDKLFKPILSLMDIHVTANVC